MRRALALHDELGGRILKTDMNGAWQFYNLVGGRRIDFTMTRVETAIGNNDLPSNRDEALADCSVEQYRLVRTRVERSPIDFRWMAGASPAMTMEMRSHRDRPHPPFP